MAADNLREKLRIQAILGLVGAFILVAGWYGAFDAALLPAIVVALAVLAILSLLTRAWVDAALCLGLIASYVGGRPFFPDQNTITYVVRTTGLNAYLLLNLVLLIGPWSWWHPLVMKLVKHRRRFGVAVFLLAFFHFGLVLRTYFGGSLATAFTAGFTFLGFSALYLLGFLAVTSRDHLQKHVRERTWQIVQLAMLACYAAVAWWAAALPGTGLTGPMLLAPVGVLIFGLLAMRSPLTERLIRRVWGWKQLHAMVYAAYALVVFHAWLAVFRDMPPLVQIGYWALFAFVVCSHAAGLVSRFWQDREARLRVSRIGRELMEGSRRYVAVGREEEFSLRVGRKFFVAGNPVAVFRLTDRYLAVSNMCAHQKGPLYKGSFNAQGHLVCPWHGWEFSTADGCGPAAFRKDCVPFYPTLLRDGYVYVAVERAPLPADVPKPSRAAGDIP